MPACVGMDITSVPLASSWGCPNPSSVRSLRRPVWSTGVAGGFNLFVCSLSNSPPSAAWVFKPACLFADCQLGANCTFGHVGLFLPNERNELNRFDPGVRRNRQHVVHTLPIFALAANPPLATAFSFWHGLTALKEAIKRLLEHSCYGSSRLPDAIELGNCRRVLSLSFL